jgi:D-3-phosphoglycerate dehydrogenase
MTELSFGEKLLIARKQLDLYQYEMAERLGVHVNSLAKYEKSEGKPHAAVLRIFELLCEQEGIRFDAYENTGKTKEQQMKVVLAEKVSPAALNVFAADADWKIVAHDQLTEGLEKELVDADALVVRSAVTVTDALLAKAPKLKVIGRAGVGVDNIDAEAATRRGVVVMNTPGANSVAVAELVLAMMLGLARSLPLANQSTHAGLWEKKSLQGSELRAKTLGILGLGRIGLEVAKRARAFGMTIIGVDPFVPAAVARENGILLVSLEELFAQADYLTLHVGLTAQTRGVINAKTIAKMKKGVRIINCARGELVEETDLVAALESGQVAGVGLDVFAKEPLTDSAFFGRKNVILTPHIAGLTAEAQEAVGVQIARQVRDYLKSGVVQNAVNMPSLTHEEYATLAPYINLAARMGAFLAQAGKSGIEAVHLVYSGKLGEWKTEMVRNAAIAGLLEGIDNVNLINAATVAEARGIRVHEEREESLRGGTASVLSVVLHTPAGTSRAAGTVIHGEQPRLLEFDGIDIETPLAGNLLVCRNNDVPGVIGQIGSTLGENGVNIANFALGREHAGPKPVKALAVVQVDAPVAGAALEALSHIEALIEARPVQLPE